MRGDAAGPRAVGRAGPERQAVRPASWRGCVSAVRRSWCAAPGTSAQAYIPGLSPVLFQPPAMWSHAPAPTSLDSAVWCTFDPSGIAEQTLVRDFNRNNKMLLRKYILFSRPVLITIHGYEDDIGEPVLGARPDLACSRQ